MRSNSARRNDSSAPSPARAADDRARQGFRPCRAHRASEAAKIGLRRRSRRRQMVSPTMPLKRGRAAMAEFADLTDVELHSNLARRQARCRRSPRRRATMTPALDPLRAQAAATDRVQVWPPPAMTGQAGPSPRLSKLATRSGQRPAGVGADEVDDLHHLRRNRHIQRRYPPGALGTYPPRRTACGTRRAALLIASRD